MVVCHHSTLLALTLIDLFTTVWFGITIITSLFIYCSIGSSGVPVSIFIWEPTVMGEPKRNART